MSNRIIMVRQNTCHTRTIDLDPTPPMNIVLYITLLLMRYFKCVISANGLLGCH